MFLLVNKYTNKLYFLFTKLLLLLSILSIAYLIIYFSHHGFKFNNFIIKRVEISGCCGNRLVQVQEIINDRCINKSLFSIDVLNIHRILTNKPWIKDVIIRREPPDRLSLFIIERKAVLWLVRQQEVFLVADDGFILGKLDLDNILPVPVVIDRKCQVNYSIVKLICAATNLRNKQREFYDRVTELRWSDRGPIAFFEGIDAPIYLSSYDVTRNIANFQILFLNELSKRFDLSRLRYIDLRWENKIAVGEPVEVHDYKK